MPPSMMIKVDVSLCGAVPRSHMHHCGATSCPPSTDRPVGFSLPVSQNPSSVPNETASLPTLADSRSKNTPNRRCAIGDGLPPTRPNHNSTPHISHTRGTIPPIETVSSSEETIMTRRPSSALLEPPKWAVPAKNKSRLVPVCEAVDSHRPVDLTHRSFFRIGRSPSSDVQLQHNTSSRRHAMLFHHPNGSCYVVDCGSSHGTFVNGVRVRNASSGSMVIPHRVRRGSLIRFGGPGAPAFVLKSFSVGFSSMVKELSTEDDKALILEAPSQPRDSLITVGNRLTSFSGAGGIEGGILKKRSFDEGDALQTTLEPAAKRQRCVSPAYELQVSEIRLVSPESPRKSRRVTFHEQPEAIYPALVTPDELSSEDEEPGN